MSKKIFFAGLIFLCILCGCTSQNPKLLKGEKVYELKVGNSAKSIKPAMIVLASELGYYKEEGVNVVFEDISTLNDTLIAIEDGKLDVSPLGIIPTMTHLCKGADLVVFGGTISEGGEAVVSAENADKIKTIDDFRGKTIAVVAAETGHLYAEYYMKQNGVDADKDVNIVVLDGMQSIIQAVKKGEADIGWVNSGFGQVAEQQGLHIVMGVGDLFPDSVCCRQTTSRKNVEENREALVRFQIANLRAYETYIEDPERVIKILMDFSGQSREYVEYCLYAQVMKIELDPCKSKVMEFYQVMSELGNVEGGKENLIDAAVDTSIYKEALDTLLKRNPESEIFRQLDEKYQKYDR